MPVDRQQLNIRLTEADTALMERVRRKITAVRSGLPVSLTEMFRQGLLALDASLPDPGPEKKGKKKADVS